MAVIEQKEGVVIMKNMRVVQNYAKNNGGGLSITHNIQGYRGSDYDCYSLENINIDIDFLGKVNCSGLLVTGSLFRENFAASSGGGFYFYSDYNASRNTIEKGGSSQENYTGSGNFISFDSSEVFIYEEISNVKNGTSVNLVQL